jgi:hypothetical protein
MVQKILKSILLIISLLLIFQGVVFATQEQLQVNIKEYVDQEVTMNPLNPGSGLWYDAHENQSKYNITGFIVIKNVNPNNKTISDIYINISDVQYITLPTLYEGRNGTFIQNNLSKGYLILHIPELNSGENSTFIYHVNTSAVRPPLNFTSNYSASKLLAGDNITVTDTVQNSFDNASYQTNTCIYDINITQKTVPINFSGTLYDFYFVPSSTTGPDAGNVTYSADNKTMYWTVLNESCLNLNSKTNVNYVVQSPYNVPKSTDYPMVNSTLRYKLNESISQIRVTEIRAISEANLGFEKKIVGPSDPVLYGSNVTWNVTAYFNTTTNITYNLTHVTLWVSKRNVNGSYTNPNVVDNDSINTTKPLKVEISPFVLVNSTNLWTSTSWLFNYSDVPSPIVWAKANFTINNDGVQLVNKSITQNGNDIYIKELYLIVGYWLEINKNITAINNNTYQITIKVHNKGNRVTPKDTVVTMYDFVPSSYSIVNDEILYGVYNQTSETIAPVGTDASPWYNVSRANTSINGTFNGTLYQFGLIPTNNLNTSFAQGPVYNENTTLIVRYNVTGSGDYKLTDVFITGLDPQQVDGAGSSKAVMISEIFNRLSSTEGIFATVASVLLLLGLLL